MSRDYLRENVQRGRRKLCRALGDLSVARSLAEPMSEDENRLMTAERSITAIIEDLEPCAFDTPDDPDWAEIVTAFQGLRPEQRAAAAAFLHYLTSGDVDDVPEVRGFDAAVDLLVEYFNQLHQHADDAEARARATERVFLGRLRLTREAKSRKMGADTSEKFQG